MICLFNSRVPILRMRKLKVKEVICPISQLEIEAKFKLKAV